MDRVRQEPAGRVLLVEDDPDVRDAMADLLEFERYRVDRAVNGRDALRLMREGPLPDLVVFDLMMPVMDGWQFRLEQRRDPVLALVPVIALSADHSSRAQAVDADAFLQKPVDSEQFVRTVSDLIQAGRARREEAERHAHTERLTTLGHLAAAVAHEINNPLGWLIGNLRIVEERLAAPANVVEQLGDTQAAVREAIEGALRIEAIVADIRSFTRRLDEPMAAFDLGEEVSSLLRLLDRQFESRVQVVHEWEGPVRVRGPAGRVRQVLTNLLTNALDSVMEASAADGRPPLVRMILQREADQIRIEVADTGTGIPEVILNRIFDPFFTTKEAGRGTGLGLFVCRGLITAMGSELHVASRVGAGTRFWFLLPAAEPAREVRPALSPDAPRPRLLVVDDEDGIRRVLSRQLQAYEVRTASCAEEALELLDADPGIDVILSDLYMPGIGGRGLYEQLHRRGGGLEQRMIFMTAGVLDEATRLFTAALGDRLLQKPVELADLEVAVAKLQARLASAPKRVARAG